MRSVVAALAVAIVSGCSSLTGEQRAQVATAGPALAVAEQKIAACRQPEVKMATEATIAAARLVLPTALLGDPDALAELNADLALINSGLTTCGRIDETVATHNRQCHGDVRLGMTKDEVKKTAWCAPDAVNKTETERGVEEQWVYRPYPEFVGMADQPNGALSFSGDKLTAIHRRE